MDNTILGSIVEIGVTKTWEKSGFRTRHVVIDIGSSSKPNPVKIDCREYAIDYLDDCSINDMLEVLYEIQGRKWEGKYFINLISENVRKLGAETKKKDQEDEFIPGNSLEEIDEWNNKHEDIPF